MTDRRARLADIVAAHAGRAGPLLPILNAVQAEFGCVDDEARTYLAAALNLSRAEVHGVVSFYHDYSAEPAPLPVLKLCRAEACQARGCDSLAADIAATARGKCTVEPVYCLGLCSVGPNAMIGQEVHARLDRAKLDRLIDRL